MTAPWFTPARSTRDWHGKATIREQAIEAALIYGSDDYARTDEALLILAAITGRPVDDDLRGDVDELIELADAVRDAEISGFRRLDVDVCIDQYEAALRRFAHPDDLTGLMDTLQCETTRPTLGLVRS